MLSKVETLRDPNLDNTDAAIQKNTQKINSLLSPLEIKVHNTIRYIDSTLFILTANSMQHQENIKRFLKNPHRYSYEYTRIDTMEIINDDNGKYLARMPTQKTTVAVRRSAFKKLPRPIMCSFILQVFLISLLLMLAGLMYKVALL